MRKPRIRARRGLSILELTCAIALLSGLVLLLHETVHLAARWQLVASEVGHRVVQSERVRRELRAAIAQGTPLGALVVTDDGRLLEGEVESATQRWGEGKNLLLRGADAYWIFEQRGHELMRRRIGFDGAVSLAPVARGLREASFELERDAAGRQLGLRYRLVFGEHSAPVEGFVGTRARPQRQARPEPPPQAPAWSWDEAPGGKR